MSGDENTSVRISAGGVSHCMAFAFAFGLAACAAATNPVLGAAYSSKRMADGKEWTTQNLNVNVARSYCYENVEANCRVYGRLYTWESAEPACMSLGNGWRLPTDAEWRRLALSYGGVSQDSDGKAAYGALLIDGVSGFDALLGGGRSTAGEYARLEAHGFYWTGTERSSTGAWLYNFGKGGRALHRQDGAEKQSAYSVRCVRE